MRAKRQPGGRKKFARATVALLGAALLGAAGEALARPAYFEQFKSNYGIGEGDNLNACGVCHFRWTGTGARNPYGHSVEQQLYLGKSVIQALTDVEGMDPDGDGYTSGDEIINWMTLPGYNCENYVNAVGAPIGYDTYIEPDEATCLDPKDIRVTPGSLGAFIREDTVRVMTATVINNGSTDPIELTSYQLLPGAPASLTLDGPAQPTIIPVGGFVEIDVIFAPTSAVFSNTHLRIVSDDPDEGVIDLPITVAAQADPTAPGAQRAPCLQSMTKALSKYMKVQLRQWGDCYLEELAGRACDTGARDYKIGRAADKLASVIGGSKDKTCSGAGLTSATLGFPSTCAEGCESVNVTGMDDIPTCLVCAQDLVMEGMLRDGVGTAPPDLPPNLISSDEAYACQERIVKAFQKSLLSMFSQLAECELAAVLADEEGGTCATDISASLAELRTTLDESLLKCTSTDDLLGCRFEGMTPDPLCLGLSSESLAVGITNAMFGIE